MSSSSEELDNIIEDLLLHPSVVSFFLDDTHARNSRSLNDSSSSIQVKKPRRYIERGREEGHKKLFDDYFSENPTYDEDLFRRRFRMRRNLFLRIVDGVSTHDSYFQNKQDATGRQGPSPLQKCTAAIRMLAYGVAADAVDEYVRIGESTTIKCVKRFVCAIIAVFGDEYLRRPNAEDIERLLHKGQQCGFPGTLNDINVLERSALFHEVLEGMAPRVAFTVNGNNYNLGYYLTDGIYPNWATFVKSIPLPQGAKAQLFAKRQEAVRKDVERAFGKCGHWDLEIHILARRKAIFLGVGAGANASQPSEMVLFSYSPMSELVWSQTEGLGIRYTSGSELGKVSPFWSTESFNIVIPSMDNPIKEDRIHSHISSEMASGRKVTGLFSAHRSLSDVLPVSLVKEHARDSRSCGQINLTNQLNPVHAHVRMSTENFEKDEQSTNSSVKKSSKVCREKGPANDGVSISTFQPFCSYQENFNENVQIANSSSSKFLHENLQYAPKLVMKGKEKMVCKKECSAKESDDSNESVESTGRIMPKRKRPWLFSNSSKNSGKSKRLKAEGKESSFMNWMSTIVNRIDRCCQPAPVTPLAVAKQQQTDEKGPSSSSHISFENHANGKMLMPFKPMGFTSLFHALYQKNITISSYGFTCLDKSDNYGLNANSTNPSQDEYPSNQNEGRACVLQTTVQLNSTPNNESKSSEEKRIRDTNCGYLENLWITRLLPKEASSSQPPIENDTIYINKQANDRFHDKGDQTLKSNFNLILPSSKNKNKESEAIVSVFARRLGTIKHANPMNFSNCKNQGDIEEKMEGSGSPNKDGRMVLWQGDEDTNTNANEANEERNIGLMEVRSSSTENFGTNGNSAMPNPNFWAQGATDETTAILEAVRRLRLSRTDVVRQLKSQIQHETLDGFFLRLRLGKLNEVVGRSGYYVARINGLSGEKCLSVTIGNFTCLVECHCISNQDFLEDELKAWFTAALKGDFRLPSREELDRKLKERYLVI